MVSCDGGLLGAEGSWEVWGRERRYGDDAFGGWDASDDDVAIAELDVVL